MPRLALPVFPLLTGEDWTHLGRALTDDHGGRIYASSPTAARRACRSRGYRVRIVYGLTEVTEVKSSPCPATGERRTEPAWIVTVYPSA